MILVVDMNWTVNSLASQEFVSPIISAIGHAAESVVKHFSEITPLDLASCDKVVLSGTALKDHATLKQLKKFSWIRAYDKPILGICAGMQTISLVFDVPLKRCLQIGMTDITTRKNNPLFGGSFQAYALHNFSVQPSEAFEVLAESSCCIQAIKHKEKKTYGVLFHPEVRNQNIIKRFLEL